MRLAIVRHAHAGSRANWSAPDRERPLSGQGMTEAKAIGVFLAEHLSPGSVNVFASPAVRCGATVTPAAESLGVDIVVDDRLFEGSPELHHRDLLTEIVAVGVDSVVCTHGDIIPSLLQLLMDDGMDHEQPLSWYKGSVWLVDHTDDAWGTATYHRPR